MTKIIQKNVLEQYKEDTTAYAIYISRMRTTPSCKDGLKPIHRRILTVAGFSCPINENSKSSSIVGKCIDMYHPHGDSSIYGAMKPMINWFETTIPLLEKQGNFGNVQGGNASDMRYTEAKISKFALEYVVAEARNSKNVIDWIDSYNNKYKEPEFFPVKVPLLLINGSFGIALGLTSRVPRHNVNEVIDATIRLIKNPDTDIVLIPDQCQPCDIIENNFKLISNTGSGTYRVRGRMVYEEVTIDRKRLRVLTITSLPDLTYFNTIKEKIEELTEDKKLFDIIDIHDKSSEFQSKYHLVLKKDSNPEYVKEFLYKNTDIQKSFNVSFEVIDGVDINRMSYKAYLQYFIEFRMITKFRLYANEYKKIQTKLHEKDAYIKVLQSGRLNEVITMIQNQNTTDDTEIIEYLVKAIDVTDLQAKYLINCSIKKITLAHLNKYIEEANGYNLLSDDYMRKMMDDTILQNEIIDELRQFKKEYGTPRKCRVISKAEVSNIPQGEFTLVLTDKNYIKKVPANSTIGSFRNDNPRQILKLQNTDNLLVFDETGKVFKLPVHKIPVSDKNTNGMDIRKISNKITSNLLSLMSEENIKDLSKHVEKKYIVVLTRSGYIKRLDLDDFTTVPPSGIVYNKLDQGDIVKEVAIVNTVSDIVVYSKNTASRMSINDIPHNKRITKGSKSMTSEYVDGLAVIDENTTDILVITDAGKVNKINTLALPIVGRNKKGCKVIKLGKDENIVAIKSVYKDSTILEVITKNNMFSFDIASINTGSSISPGVKLMSIKTDIILKTIVK